MEPQGQLTVRVGLAWEVPDQPVCYPLQPPWASRPAASALRRRGRGPPMESSSHAGCSRTSSPAPKLPLSLRSQKTLWGHEAHLLILKRRKLSPRGRPRVTPRVGAGGGGGVLAPGEQRVVSPQALLLSLPRCPPGFPESPLYAWHYAGAGSWPPASILASAMVRVFLNL